MHVVLVLKIENGLLQYAMLFSGGINCLDGPRNVEIHLAHIVLFLYSLERVQDRAVALSHVVTIILLPFLARYL